MQLTSIYEIPQAYSRVFSEDSRVAQQVASMISSLISEMHEKMPWISFSERCKYVYVNSRPLVMEDILYLKKFVDNETTHLLGIASMNTNGYVREAAMLDLEKFPDPHTLPYLLMRLNDWVPSISQKALSICQSKLGEFHPIEWLKNYPLIQWLETTHRARLDLFQQDLLQYIARKEFRLEVLNYLEKASVKANLFYWKTLSTEHLISNGILEVLLKNKYPEVRGLGVSFLANTRDYDNHLRKLCDDPSLRVRYLAVRSIPKDQWPAYKSLYEHMLCDSARKLREYSRFVLSSLYAQDFRPKYKEYLKETHTSNKLGALLGWLEVVQIDDSREIENITQHPSSKVRLAAYKALSRIALPKTSKPFLSGIRDSNSKVRKFCAQVLRSMANEVKEETVALLKDPRPEVRVLAVAILSGLTPGEFLKNILQTISLNDAITRDHAWEILKKWYWKHRVRPYFSLSPILYDEVTALYQKVNEGGVVPCRCASFWRGSDEAGGVPELLKLLRPK